MTPSTLLLDEMIDRILDEEGSGFTNDAQDRPTKYGVTLATYRGLRPAATQSDIEALTEEQARAFYRWYLAPFADLAVSERIWRNLLDAVVLHGKTGAVECLQRAVGARVDGLFGAITLSMLMKMSENTFLLAFAKARLDVMVADVQRDLTTKFGSQAVEGSDAKYLRGWVRRVLDMAYGDA